MIKIVEGTAGDITDADSELVDYELDSLQFTYRDRIHTKSGAISEDEYNFYVAVFKKQIMISGRSWV